MLEERNGQASGRVGFIDFGIVGRVSPGTWMAVEALLTSVATRDFDTMARALVTVGATSTDVDIKVLFQLLSSLSAAFATACTFTVSLAMHIVNAPLLTRFSALRINEVSSCKVTLLLLWLLHVQCPLVMSKILDNR